MVLFTLIVNLFSPVFMLIGIIASLILAFKRLIVARFYFDLLIVCLTANLGTTIRLGIFSVKFDAGNDFLLFCGSLALFD